LINASSSSASSGTVTEAADELGDQAVAEQVVGLDVAEWVLLDLRAGQGPRRLLPW